MATSQTVIKVNSVINVQTFTITSPKSSPRKQQFQTQAAEVVTITGLMTLTLTNRQCQITENPINLTVAVLNVQLGSVVVRVLDMRTTGHGFNSQPLHCWASTLDKMFTTCAQCLCYHAKFGHSRSNSASVITEIYQTDGFTIITSRSAC